MEEFRVIDPDGKEHYVPNLAKYCDDKGLSYSAMIRVVNGYSKSHQGWTGYHCREDMARKAKETEASLIQCTEKRSKDETTLMYNDLTGEEVLMERLTDFVEKYNLNKGAISMVCKGIRKSHKGWRVKIESN